MNATDFDLEALQELLYSGRKHWKSGYNVTKISPLGDISSHEGAPMWWNCEFLFRPDPEEVRAEALEMISKALLNPVVTVDPSDPKITIGSGDTAVTIEVISRKGYGVLLVSEGDRTVEITK